MSSLQKPSSSSLQNVIRIASPLPSSEQTAKQQSVLKFSDQRKNEQGDIIRFLVDHNIKFSKPNYSQKDYEAIVKIYNIYEIKEEKKNEKRPVEYSAIYKKFSNFFEKKKENIPKGLFKGDNDKSDSRSGSPPRRNKANRSFSPSPGLDSTSKKPRDKSKENMETTKKSGKQTKSPGSPGWETRKRLNKSSTSSPNLFSTNHRHINDEKGDLEKIYGPLLNFFHDNNKQPLGSKSPEKTKNVEEEYHSKSAKKKHRELGDKVTLKKQEITPLLKRYQMNFEEEATSSKGPKPVSEYSAFTEYPSNKFKQEMESRRKKQNSFIKLEEESQKDHMQIFEKPVKDDQRKNFLKDTISSQRKSIKCDEGSPVPLRKYSISDNNSLSPIRDSRVRKSITGGFSETRKSSRVAESFVSKDGLQEDYRNGRGISPVFEPCFGGAKEKIRKEDEINIQLEKNFKDIVKKELGPYDKTKMDTEAARKHYQKAVQSLYERVDMLSSEELVFYYKFILNRAKLLYIDFLNQRGIKLC